MGRPATVWATTTTTPPPPHWSFSSTHIPFPSTPPPHPSGLCGAADQLAGKGECVVMLVRASHCAAPSRPWLFAGHFTPVPAVHQVRGMGHVGRGGDLGERKGGGAAHRIPPPLYHA